MLPVYWALHQELRHVNSNHPMDKAFPPFSMKMKMKEPESREFK